MIKMSLLASVTFPNPHKNVQKGSNNNVIPSGHPTSDTGILHFGVYPLLRTERNSKSLNANVPNWAWFTKIPPKIVLSCVLAQTDCSFCFGQRVAGNQLRMRALTTTGANLVEADCVKSSDRERSMVELELLVEEASKRIVARRKKVQYGRVSARKSQLSVMKRKTTRWNQEEMRAWRKNTWKCSLEIKLVRGGS